MTGVWVSTDNPVFAAPPLRGREDEVAVLENHLDSLVNGVGSVVVIEGAPGLGKTRLLREVFARGLRMGLRGGHGMADPLDRVVGLAPLMEALFEDDPPLIDRKALRDVHAAPEQRFWLLQEIEALLEEAALNGPLFICLDDLQWADNGTAAALRSLPQRLSTFPIGWFLTTRPGQGSAQLVTAIADIVAAGAAKVHLGPLTEAAVAMLVADMLGGEPDDTVLAHASRTRGNPFLRSTSSAGWPKKASLRSRLVARS